MPPFHLIDPTRLAVELAYTLIVVFLCFTIYYKTREIYDLTRHEGINYFRLTFLFFGFAYISRFISILLKLMVITFDIDFPRHIFGIFPLVFIGYFSTMAILSLTYSILWKKLQIKHSFLIFNVIALLISGIAFISRSSFILTLSQAVLLIFTSIIIVYYIISKSGKISRLYILYILFFLFWMVNIIALGPRRFIPFEVQTVFQIISVVVIGIIYHRVTKWTR
ncbi:MAG: hypothetical protein GIS02_06070 [Methanosarcinales archaeon]|uniref:Uncharacterized protein n=1 Tax=Candidatus Ethanoperedens thermophilum TaxID=2766897 RepID=A0A848DAG5_9EURY|nr:hypothetical protein [Candidatus Ethanoperedens thermophilum]